MVNLSRKGKPSKSQKKSVEKKPFLSDRQKKLFLIVILAMLLLIPVFDVVRVFRCRAECLPTIKTPYPEVACEIKCPFSWKKK